MSVSGEDYLKRLEEANSKAPDEIQDDDFQLEIEETIPDDADEKADEVKDSKAEEITAEEENNSDSDEAEKEDEEADDSEEIEESAEDSEEKEEPESESENAVKEETKEASDTLEEAKEEEPASESKETKEEETVEVVDSEEVSGDASEKDEEIAELKDSLLRNMAEFDNYRKRTEKEKTAMFELGAAEVIKKLLPVIDNFERGLKSVSDDKKQKDAFVEGMDMIYKQAVKMLKDLGVEPIEAVGKEFDPNYHNAVMHVDDDSVGDSIIVEELEKGYIYRNTVIRYSMVKVAN